jgi:hypothetical protein
MGAPMLTFFKFWLRNKSPALAMLAKLLFVASCSLWPIIVLLPVALWVSVYYFFAAYMVLLSVDLAYVYYAVVYAGYDIPRSLGNYRHIVLLPLAIKILKPNLLVKKTQNLED